MAFYKLLCYRTKVKPWDRDRVMYPDIEAVVDMIRTGAIVDAIRPFVDSSLLI